MRRPWCIVHRFSHNQERTERRIIVIQKTPHHHTFRTIFIYTIMLSSFFPTATDGDDVLLLEKPAANWEKEAFPLGNGRLGCMVFGGIEEERIQFNVDSLWTGDENLSGNYKADGMGWHQNFGNLYVALDSRGPVTDYSRRLNMSRAVCRVAYEQDGSEFARETFCSNADQVMVSRMTAGAKGQVFRTHQACRCARRKRLPLDPTASPLPAHWPTEWSTRPRSWLWSRAERSGRQRRDAGFQRLRQPDPYPCGRHELRDGLRQEVER